MGSTKARCQGWVNQNDCDKANYSDLQRAKNVPPKTKAECETGCGNRGIGVLLFPKIANCGNPNSPEGFDRGDLGNRADVSADVVTLRTISNQHPTPPPKGTKSQTFGYSSPGTHCESWRTTRS